MDLPKLCTTRLFDQNFGMCISPQDILVPFFSNNATNYFRPWKLCEEFATKDFGSTIDNTKDKFKITLDVQHFLPNEINVKVNDREIIIEGKHEEKEDEHGFISRQFVRRYLLPKDCISDSVTSTLSSDGVLRIIASKKTTKEIKAGENIVPIKMAGPCRKTGTSTVEEKTQISDEAKIDKGEKKTEMCEMKKDKRETKKKCEMEKDTAQKTQKIEMKNDEKTKSETQLMVKEEHSRLLKPELLGEAVSGNTEKLISESRKETDELLRLMSVVRTMPNPTEEKLDQAIGQCQAAMKELKKDKAESNISAISEMTRVASGMATSEITSSSMASAEMSSVKSTMSSEITEMTMSSSSKSSTESVSEIICAELKEAASENT